MYEDNINSQPLIINGNDIDEIIKDPVAINTVKNILTHKENVKKRLLFLADELYKRAYHHDDSKLQIPEIMYLIEMDREPRYPYGSDEYFDKMKRWECFFKHHYENNRHHPDSFPDGVEGMNLADLCEYVVDIISYFDELHVSGALDTINKQQERFGLDNQLTQILKNTLLEYFSWFADIKPPCDKWADDCKKPSEKPAPKRNYDLSKMEKEINTYNKNKTFPKQKTTYV